MYPHVTYMWVVMILLLAIAYLTTRRLQLLPGAGQSLMELVVGGLLGFMERVMGHHAKAAFPDHRGDRAVYRHRQPAGIIPVLFSPTVNINITAGCAITIFLYYQYIGFRRHGVAYIKHFTGPVWWLAPLMLPIELISHFIRPFTLALRLFANMRGHEIVLIIITLLVPSRRATAHCVPGDFRELHSGIRVHAAVDDLHRRCGRGASLTRRR